MKHAFGVLITVMISIDSYSPKYICHDTKPGTLAKQSHNHNKPDDAMTALSYTDALGIIESVAKRSAQGKSEQDERVSLQEALGRRASRDCFAEESTPPVDTSAMDGFAINSSHTTEATAESPPRFCVIGTCAAGDPAVSIKLGVASGVLASGMRPCVEIMTGAQFPLDEPDSEPLDACVKVEDVRQISSSEGRFIEVCRPVAVRANRRPAGGDISTGACVIGKGEVLRSTHIMSLASLGITHIWAQRTIKVGIWSTGKEICQSTRDVNGPYLTAALKEHGIEACFLGTIGDSREEVSDMVRHIQDLVESEQLDLLVTTGGVSAGRYDFVKDALLQAGARIHFHSLPIRPGHPVLFASLTSRADRQTAFFGLPGNPGATATTFKFLALPFLSSLRGEEGESPTWAVLEADAISSGAQNGYECSKKKLVRKSLDCFRHGFVSPRRGDGERTVRLNPDQSPSKVYSFVRANCWVHIPFNAQELDGTLVACFELFPGSIRE